MRAAHRLLLVLGVLAAVSGCGPNAQSPMTRGLLPTSGIPATASPTSSPRPMSDGTLAAASPSTPQPRVSSAPQPSSPATPLPFGAPTARPPTGTSSPAALRAFRPCPAADLAAVLQQPNAATGGELLGHLVVINRSATVCSLSGEPRITLLDTRDQPVPIPIRYCPSGPPHVSSIFACTPDQPVVLPPNPPPLKTVGWGPGQAALLLTWQTHDGAGSCRIPDPPVVSKIALQLADTGETLVVATNGYLARAACGAGISVYSFR